MSSAKLIVKHPFAVIRSAVETLDIVDGMSAGLSPATIRVLTKKNHYINIGLQALDEKSCEILKNANSYEVSDTELKDAYDQIVAHVKKFVQEEADRDARENPQNSQRLSREVGKNPSREAINA